MTFERVARGLVAFKAQTPGAGQGMVPFMQDALAYCAELVRMADRDRFIASLFAPAESRAARFMRSMHSTSSGARSRRGATALPGEIRLQWWADVINASGTMKQRPIRLRRLCLRR